MNIKKRDTGIYLARAVVLILLFGVFLLFYTNFIFAANPVGPDELISTANETKAASGAMTFNVSGGYVSTFNLTATIQDFRWKAFVGNVTGSFTLDDSAGSTIYDWTLSTITGRVYTTRNSTTISWATMSCSNLTLLEQENTWLSHSNIDDNLTKTFTIESPDHDSLNVGPVTIPADTCPTLSTYVNNVSQAQGADVFEEVALIDTNNVTVFATILENDAVGFDGGQYDFQMLVPENGSAAWESSTAYYLYVELGN